MSLKGYGPSSSVANASSLVLALVAPSGDATGVTDTAAINAALATVSAAGGGIVRAQAGQVYKVASSLTRTVQFPSGSTGSRNVCIPIPSNCMLDMNGSTLQLQGASEAAIVCVDKLDNSARNADLGLKNAILDGRSISMSLTSLASFFYTDRLTLTNVKIINCTFSGGWVVDVTDSRFDEIRSDNCQGQPWTFGDPQPTGSGHNGVYRSMFGKLYGQNTTRLNSGSQPGNPFDLVLYSCTIESILAYNCSAGIKLQQPSSDVTVGEVVIDTCGEANALNSGFKIQGDPTYAAGTDRPTRITVGQVTAKNCLNMGLYVHHSQDCEVQTYRGFNNVTHDASSGHTDIFLGGNNNFRLLDAASINSNAAGLRVNQDSGAGTELGSRVDYLKVTNPGQNAAALIRDGVRVDTASNINFGTVELVDNQGSPTMQIGFNVTSAGAIGRVDNFTSTGNVSDEFVGVALFRYPGISALAPSTAKRETYERRGRGTSSIATGTTGVLTLFAIELPKGLVVKNITFEAGSVGITTATHWWFSLHDSARVMLAVTADQVAAAWAATTRKTLAIATVASGAASRFVTTYDGLYYFGLMVAAATLPNLNAVGLATSVGGDVPILNGTADAAQTTPPAFPFTAAALTALACHPYAYAS